MSTLMLYTEVERHAMAVADKSKKDGREVVSSLVPDPEQVGGSQGNVRNRQENAETECLYSGKKGHKESYC